MEIITFENSIVSDVLASPQRSPPQIQNQTTPPTSRLRLTTIAENVREDTGNLARLKLFDLVFIIDESDSMVERDGAEAVGADGSLVHQSRWETLADGMRYVADLARHHDSDGVDVRFLYNDARDEYEVIDGRRVLDLLAREVVWTVLQTHLDGYEEFREKMRGAPASGAPRPPVPKKLNLVVITDSEVADTDEVEQTIVDAARKLEALDAPPNQIGIQFLQVGRSVEAAEWLRTLDDDLHKIRGMKDVSVPLPRALLQHLAPAETT